MKKMWIAAGVVVAGIALGLGINAGITQARTGISSGTVAEWWTDCGQSTTDAIDTISRNGVGMSDPGAAEVLGNAHANDYLTWTKCAATAPASVATQYGTVVSDGTAMVAALQLGNTSAAAYLGGQVVGDSLALGIEVQRG